jgi:hypothetical protein
MAPVLVGNVIVALLSYPAIGSDPATVEPIADAGLTRYAGPDPVVLDGSRSYDPDSSGPLSYTWRQTSGPSVVIIDANKATPTIAGSIQPDEGRDSTPKPQGFLQTDEIQECEFELVVSDGELTSLPDRVKVLIVPDFGANVLTLQNDSFDQNKPTFVFFGGGDCISGGGTVGSKDWIEKANVVSFLYYEPDPNYTPGKVDAPRTYYRCGDMIIVLLSHVVPDYNQPIQTCGWSTGGQPAVDVGIHLNLSYADARYAVNRVTVLDARACRDHSESFLQFLESSVDGEQCWIDNHRGSADGPFPSWPSFYPNVLRVGSSLSHSGVISWYANSLTDSDMNQFNHGVVGGAYWSVIGPGKNLQLATTPGVETYSFRWHGDESSGYMDFWDESHYPGRLPEPVTLIGPLDVEDPNGFVLTCEESENAVGYELLFGADPYRVMDYDIISDTPAPPNDVITAIPSDKTWWTVRVRDQYGSTIYADPISMVAYNPKPTNGAVHPETWVNLSWNEGVMATSYDVYFGENFGDVQDGTAEVFRGSQTTTYFIVGFTGFPYPDGLVSGRTYFWRIDDVGSDGTVIHKGKIWRFAVSL